MAYNSNSSGGYALQSFRVPKRNISINGIDRKSRPYNPKFHEKQIGPCKEFEEFVKNGLISNPKFGVKHCFFTKELSEENKSSLLEKLPAIGDEKNSGWETVETYSEDGSNPSKEVSEAIDLYHSFEDPESKNCLTMYGKVEFDINFADLGMVLSEEDGGVLYPYGVVFFSDNKSFVNQFSATCAVMNNRLEKAKNNVYIKPIEDWTKAHIEGSFKTNGHFCIFFVNDEVKYEDRVTENFNGKFTKVTVYDIEVGLTRERGGKITKVGVKKVTTITDVPTGKDEDAFGSEIDWLIKNMFAKHMISPIASNRFVSDYIYLIGDTPRYYDLSIFQETDEGRKGDDENFLGKSKKESKNTKKNKSKGKNKNNESKKESVEESKDETTETVQDSTKQNDDAEVKVSDELKEAEDGNSN